MNTPCFDLLGPVLGPAHGHVLVASCLNVPQEQAYGLAAVGSLDCSHRCSSSHNSAIMEQDTVQVSILLCVNACSYPASSWKGSTRTCNMLV